MVLVGQNLSSDKLRNIKVHVFLNKFYSCSLQEGELPVSIAVDNTCEFWCRGASVAGQSLGDLPRKNCFECSPYKQICIVLANPSKQIPQMYLLFRLPMEPLWFASVTVDCTVS